MSNQPRNMIPKDLLALIFGIMIIGTFIYIIYSHSKPTVAATTLNNVNIPSTNNTNDPVQNSPSVNTLNSGNNGVTTGYSVLFVSNGVFSQFSATPQEYTFLKGLIGSDSKGTGTIKVFLVDNGQINEYLISDKMYAIISNMAAIDTPASNASPSATPNVTPSPTLNTTPSPTLNVSPDPTPDVSPNLTPNTSPNPTPIILP